MATRTQLCLYKVVHNNNKLLLNFNVGQNRALLRLYILKSMGLVTTSEKE